MKFSLFTNFKFSVFSCLGNMVWSSLSTSQRHKGAANSARLPLSSKLYAFVRVP